MSSFNEFTIRHIYRHENYRANDLAQRASGYNINKNYFGFGEEPVLSNCDTNVEKFFFLR